MNTESLITKLKERGLKVTPQRVLVMKAVAVSGDHPTAEDIFKVAKVELPNIAIGTIYNILDRLVKNGLIERISTMGDKMRYDVILESHHHLLSSDSDMIEDYYDEGLTGVIGRYLDKNTIPGFKVSGFKLNISGEFNKSGKN